MISNNKIRFESSIERVLYDIKLRYGEKLNRLSIHSLSPSLRAETIRSFKKQSKIFEKKSSEVFEPEHFNDGETFQIGG
jgi:hypothetical protein